MVAKTESKVVLNGTEDENESAAPFALLFVLEDLAVNGRKAMLEVLRSEAKGGKKRFDDRLFFRSGLSGSPAACLPTVLGGGEEPDREVLQDIQQQIFDRLVSDKARLNPALGSLLKAAAERKIPTLALTSLPEETAGALASRLRLEGFGTQLFMVKDVAGDFPAPDAWVKAARSLQRRPRACGAVVANARASRGAIMAGMRFIAVPDELTSFEDYGGAT
ncbi:MAG: hypothetical protein KJ726_10670, partial [Verrucomicrobia bacterium]|nr:hypothetical protein [Verrucomicrobiota bacterium]